MQSLLVSLIAFLAATSIAVPIVEPRQLPLPGIGNPLEPVTGALSSVGKTVPPALNRATDSLQPSKKNATQPAQPAAQPAKGGQVPPTAQKADPLGGLPGLGAVTGLLGGVL
ncbi:hypothetical protein F5Y10DRAFT_108897 [Nemania abortiva]|nr:hypothetical protein F5Y10DRAFT_108897 [Nemania abortiva]